MPDRIQTDKRPTKLYKILMIIAAVMAVVGFLMIFVWDKLFGHSAEQIGIMLSLFLINVGIPTFFISLYQYSDASFYNRRVNRNAPVNRYASDSKIAGILSLVIYVILLIMDIIYLVVWYGYEESAIVLFVLILIALTAFPVLSLIFFRQGNKKKYIDHVDINDGRHKVRRNLLSSVILLLFLGFIGVIGIVCANSMTKYVYRSRNSAHDRWDEDFYSNATMQISSDDLIGEEWSPEVENRTPQLSFEEVEGAAYYIIYMVDETEGCRVAWYVENTNDVEFPAGSDEGFFRGITSHRTAPHRYSITVYAMAGAPDHETPIIDTNRDSSFAPMYLYYEILNVSDRSHYPTLYGNVLAYGYISGEY